MGDMERECTGMRANGKHDAKCSSMVRNEDESRQGKARHCSHIQYV